MIILRVTMMMNWNPVDKLRDMFQKHQADYN